MPTSDPEAGPSVKKTEYVVLSMVDDDGWRDVARITASSSAAAIDKHVGRRDLTGQTIAFVAVPARSWQPVEPETETVTKTTLKPLTRTTPTDGAA